MPGSRVRVPLLLYWYRHLKAIWNRAFSESAISIGGGRFCVPCGPVWPTIAVYDHKSCIEAAAGARGRAGPVAPDDIRCVTGSSWTPEKATVAAAAQNNGWICCQRIEVSRGRRRHPHADRGQTPPLGREHSRSWTPILGRCIAWFRVSPVPEWIAIQGRQSTLEGRRTVVSPMVRRPRQILGRGYHRRVRLMSSSFNCHSITGV